MPDGQTDHTPQDKSQDSDGDRGGFLSFLIVIGPVFLVFALMVALLLGMMGYMDFLEERGTEQACIERYGDGSEYVGDTGFASNTGICNTPDGQKYVEIQMASIGPGTFADYVTGVEP